MAGAMDLSERRIVENTLCTLIHKHGIELYSEDSVLRFSALISDSFGCRYSRYRKLLILAIHERIPSRLLAKKNKLEELFLKNLQDSFAREYDIKINSAREIIEIFAEGLKSNIDDKEKVDNKIEWEENLFSKTESRKEEDYSMFFRRKAFVKPFAILFVLLIFSLAVRNSVKYDILPQPSLSTEGKASPQIDLQSQSQKSEETEEKLLTQSEIRSAINQYNAGNYKSAVPVLKEAARQKHAEAAFYYGQALRYGRGDITKNLDLAIENLKISERGGFIPASNSLGIIFRDNIGGPEGRRTAYEFFRAGANASTPDPYAVYNYSSCKAEGFGCDVDIDEAITFLHKGINYCYMNQLAYPQSVVDELREDMVLKLIKVTDDNFNFGTIETVAVLLTQNVDRPYDQLYLCTRWLTENVSYDTSKRIRSVEGTFRNRMGVCEGYSKCLKVMLDTINISNQIVDGNWKGNVGHSWNVVYIDRPIYIDATWAAGYVTSDNLFVKAYDATWFDTPYEIFASKHIPG